MSTHADMFAEGGLPLLFEHFGDASRVTYTARRGVAVELTAIVGDERAEEMQIGTGRRRVLRRNLTLTTDPAGDYGGVLVPQLTDTVAIDGVSYAVESVRPLREDMFDLTVIRSEPLEVSRPDYRDPRRM